jgi:hypothetical protein
MGRAKAVWPAYKSKERISYSDLPELSPERYAEIGKHFTARQFRNVEDALGAPAGFSLLWKMQRAVYLYQTIEAGRAGEIGFLRHMPKRKRENTVATLLKKTESYLSFVNEYYKPILELSSQNRLAALQLHLIGLMKDAAEKRAAIEAEISPGAPFAAWQVYLWAIAATYETVHGRGSAKIPWATKAFDRGDDDFATGKPYGPFLSYAQECLSLVNVQLSDEAIRSGLRNYAKRREAIMQSELYSCFRAW